MIRLPRFTKEQMKVLGKVCSFLISLAFAIFVYFLVISINEEYFIHIPIEIIYTILFVISLVAMVLVNGGLGDGILKNPKEYLRSEWSEEKKAKFLQNIPVRIKWKKALSVMVLDFLLPIILDFAIIYIGDLVG